MGPDPEGSENDEFVDETPTCFATSDGTPVWDNGFLHVYIYRDEPFVCIIS